MGVNKSIGRYLREKKISIAEASERSGIKYNTLNSIFKNPTGNTGADKVKVVEELSY